MVASSASSAIDSRGKSRLALVQAFALAVVQAFLLTERAFYRLVRAGAHSARLDDLGAAPSGCVPSAFPVSPDGDAPPGMRGAHLEERLVARFWRTSRQKAAHTGEHPMNSKNRMKLVAVVQYGEGDEKKSRWTNIGVAFQNRDGSWNLRFDYIPARMADTTIQLRAFDSRTEDQPSA
jgi:hypothetical protein